MGEELHELLGLLVHVYSLYGILQPQLELLQLLVLVHRTSILSLLNVTALQFLHATGSVLHYGSGTRQHSQKLQEEVFMQPQFIIDVIKYVIRKSTNHYLSTLCSSSAALPVSLIES
jgi:hypothetical protein